MIRVYCEYSLYDEGTSEYLESGNYCNRFSYWDNNQKVTLEDVMIKDIKSDEVILGSLNDYDTDIVISIDKIDEWD